MESISSTHFIATQVKGSVQLTEVTSAGDKEVNYKETNILPLSNKQLQPDQVELSEESKAKSAEAEEKEENKKNIDASSLNNVMTKEDIAAENKADESELDKEIRKLSMEILELSTKIEMLKAKEDQESIKERQALEVDLAIKKGALEVAMERMLQLAALS